MKNLSFFKEFRSLEKNPKVKELIGFQDTSLITLDLCRDRKGGQTSYFSYFV